MVSTLRIPVGYAQWRIHRGGGRGDRPPLDWSKGKFTKYRLAAGLRPDLLGELKRSPRHPSRNKGGVLLLRGGKTWLR